MPEKVHEFIFVPMTDDDMLTTGVDLAQACIDIQRITVRKKKAMESFKHRLKALEEKREQLSEQLKKGGSDQHLECQKEYDRAAGIAYFYIDGQEVKQRPMTGEELQQPSVFEGGQGADNGTNPGPPIVDDGMEVFCECGAQLDDPEQICPECGAAPDGFEALVNTASQNPPDESTFFGGNAEAIEEHVDRESGRRA